MYMCNIGITISSAFAGIGSSRDTPLPEPNNGCFRDYADMTYMHHTVSVLLA